ncbi:MAG TPA: HAD hydrolase-like protein [Candidatus Saccharimonadales bacterium]|nr:HAD hydrolase-like protein [Candidatus Saccharimonadales bacterium]
MKPIAFGHFPNKQAAPRHLPDFTAQSVTTIDFAYLQKLGVKHVLFDLDLTLRTSKAQELESAIVTYLAEQKKAGAFETLSLATNSLGNVTPFAKTLGARLYQPFVERKRLIKKPSLAFFERIRSDLGAQSNEIAMIGDKVRADVAGGNGAGFFTILVEPLGKDLLHDRLLLVRFREKRLLASAKSALKLVKDTH